MTRWLLNTFPTLLLAIIVIGVLVLFAATGQYLVRHRWPHVAEGEHNDVAGILLGLLAAVYGIVLAFVIVALYEDFQAADAIVRQEATEIEQIERDSRVFAADVHGQIQRDLDEYTRIVVAREFALMREGESSPLAWKQVDDLYATFQGFDPMGDRQSAFYGEAISKLNDFVGARRERLHFAEESLPAAFQFLIYGGAFLLVGFMWFVGTNNLRVQMLMITSVAALVGLNLLLVVLLDHPFSGDLAVSSHPFEERALER